MIQGTVLYFILKEDFSLFKMNRSNTWILLYEKARLNLNCYRVLKYSYILSLAFYQQKFCYINYILNQGKII